MNTKFISLVTLSLSLITLLISCRGEEASLYTLDEFAGISDVFSFKECSGGFKYVGSIDTIQIDKEINKNAANILKYAVEQTLTAVPINVRKIFYQANGKILVTTTKKAQSACGGVINKEEFKAYVYGGSISSINTCWQLSDGVPTVFVEDDVAKIRHSLLRAFSYVYSQLIYRALEKSKKVDMSADKQMFKNLKIAFLTDLIKVNKSRMKAFLSMDPTLELKTVDGKTSIVSKGNSETESSERLSQYVFAEAVDSYYCNSKTNKTFKEKFPNTWEVFDKMHD